MEKFLKVGDQVRYGEHSAEKYDVKDDPDFPDGEYFVVRVQDLRGVRRVIAKGTKCSHHDWMVSGTVDHDGQIKSLYCRKCGKLTQSNCADALGDSNA